MALGYGAPGLKNSPTQAYNAPVAEQEVPDAEKIIPGLINRLDTIEFGLKEVENVLQRIVSRVLRFDSPIEASKDSEEPRSNTSVHAIRERLDVISSQLERIAKSAYTLDTL